MNILKFTRLYAFGFLLAISAQAAQPSTPAIFDRIENGTIYFTAPNNGTPLAPLKTPIFDPKYIGMIQAQEGAPYLILSGKTCQDCNDDPRIFIYRATGGKPYRLTYPGRLVDPKNGLVFEGRAFFGKCLPGRGDVYVVFQREKLDRKKGLQSSVYVAEGGAKFLQESLIEKHLPGIKHATHGVKQKVCKEIDGKNRTVSSKIIDLRARDDEESDDEDDDEEDQIPGT